MKLDDVVSRLEQCGLGEKEARAFAHLTHLGKSKVTDLAKAAALKRAETYQVLERLQSRGLVEATLERPRQFSAVEPSRALDILVEERAQGLKTVEGLRGDLEARLAKLGGGASEPAGEAFRVLHDRNQIAGQLARTLRAARTELCVVASSRSLFRLLLDEGLETEFLAAHERGVRIRILTEVLPGQEDVLSRLAGFAEVRHLMVPRPLRFFIADEKEIVQYVTADPLGSATKETAMWMGARDHVQAQRAFFDDLWSGAMTAPARVEELRSGRATGQVNVVKGRFTRYEKEKEMLLRAKEDVALLLPPDEVARFHASGVQRVLQSRIREGVRVRVLVAPGTPFDVKGVEVREADVAGDLPRVFVDRAEALVVLPGEGEKAGVTAVDEHAVWVTLGPSVESLFAAFERRWNGGS